MSVEIGDLVYHEHTKKYGIVINIDTRPFYDNGSNTCIQWLDGNNSWHFADNALMWKLDADKLIKRLTRKKKA